MKTISRKRLENVLTVIGWIIIGYAVFALTLFIIRSGVLGNGMV